MRNQSAIQPRVIFLSSTAYDIPDLRAELPAFLKLNGFEVLHHESPAFPIAAGLHSHDVCLDAIPQCDAFVLIIDRRYGGKYSGTKFPSKDISITWYEFEIAFKTGKPTHVFVRDKVWNERPSYKTNRDGYVPVHVDDTRVFDFLDQIVLSHKSNWVTTFTDVTDLKPRVLAQLAPTTRQITVLFYGPPPTVNGSLLTVTIWCRRPATRYHSPHRIMPTRLETLQALEIHDASGNVFLDDNWLPFYIAPGGRYRQIGCSAYAVSGWLADRVQTTDYTLLTLNLTEPEAQALSQHLSEDPPTALFFHPHYAGMSLMVASDITDIEALRTLLSEGVAEANSSRSIVECLAALKLLLKSKRQWSDPHVMEDECKTDDCLLTLARAAPNLGLEVRRVLFRVVWSFVGDGRKVAGGTVGGGAVTALAHMANLFEDMQIRKIEQLLDENIFDSNWEIVGDAAFLLMKIRDRISTANLKRYFHGLGSWILSLETYVIQPVVAESYTELARDFEPDREVVRRIDEWKKRAASWSCQQPKQKQKQKQKQKAKSKKVP